MIRVAITGYGNLGKGVESAIAQNEDMVLTHVFTRRNPDSIEINTPNVKKVLLDEALNYKDEIDVMIICGGSATDLPKITPMLAENFNVIDSFDTHANIPVHFKNVDVASRKGNKTSMISVGWDPGMFSIMRLYANAILPEGKDYTFWGRGVSQGHSDAVRRIEGVEDARQYTVPVPAAVDSVLSGNTPELSTREKHTRECFVVAKPGADLSRIEKEIKEMPNYFSDYDTTVTFITKEEMEKNHKGLPHGGFVIRNGKTGFDKEYNNTISYNLKLDSNPMFTGSVLAAYARAICKMNARGIYGCKTVFDVAPADIINLSDEEIRAHLL